MSTSRLDAEGYLAKINRDIAAVTARRDRAAAEASAVLDRVHAEGRRSATPAEGNLIGTLRGQRHAAEDERRRLLRERETFAVIADEDRQYIRLANQRVPSGFPVADRGRPAYDQVARIGAEARTYNPQVDREAGGEAGAAFLLDAGRALLGDPLAADRLVRHQREEITERPGLSGLAGRASSSASFSGLIVPAYVTDLYAPAVSPMRPFADICNKHPLPDIGMTVTISRITTPTSVGLQATENTAVSTQDIDDTSLTENVQTAAGSLIVSRQAVDRGVLTDEVTTSDLLKRYASTLDSTLINQATTGLAAVSTSQTYTNATLDTTAIPAFWKSLIQAQNTVETTLLAQAAPSHFILSPRRWNWATAAVSASWPVVAGTSVPPQSWAAQLTNEYGAAVRAQLPTGMLITVDANVSTVCLGTALTGGTQDHVYAVAADECHLWEMPEQAVLLRAEQPAAASLGILYVCWGYFAYTHRRYTGASVVVNGTGLATPSFA